MKLITRTLARSFAKSPGLILIFGYAVLIAMGTSFLLLPIATVKGKLALIDALFTAASAVCVTGLTVVDTSGVFTLLGKSVILVLIQIGGIGIMVVSTIFVFSIGKKVSMTGRILIRDTYSYGEGKGIFSLVKDVLFFTMAIELIGAILMFFRFHSQGSTGMAVFYALFHSVSAFCNAGFSLFSDSFLQYQNDWIINLSICTLIILGGIGFIVLSEIKNHFSLSCRAWSFLSLHTKLVLSSTLLLLVISTALIFLLEWQNTLSGKPVPYKILGAFFQAVNARTAGFNTVQIGDLTNETLFLIIILMFIGAAPGSCGGGVKITTVSSMTILGVSRLLGQEYPQVFHRKISDTSIAKAVSLIMISLLVIIIGIILLQQTEIGEISHRLSRGTFLELMFETVSAFGTVGLSTGITTRLSVSGKLIVAIMMFIGRLGPLVIAMAVSKKKASKKYYYAQENIMIG